MTKRTDEARARAGPHMRLALVAMKVNLHSPSQLSIVTRADHPIYFKRDGACIAETMTYESFHSSFPANCSVQTRMLIAIEHFQAD